MIMKKIAAVVLLLLSESIFANTLSLEDFSKLSSSDYVPTPLIVNQITLSPVASTSPKNEVVQENVDVRLNDIESIRHRFCELAKNKCNDSDYKYYQSIVAQSHLNFASGGEFVLIGDKSPNKQKMHIFIVYEKEPYYIGSTKISTGEKSRYDHYYTPIGIFENKTDILNYRALGTKNAKGIRGNGSKGARVYDFGWVNANKSWKHKVKTTPIRFQMHATDVDYLEGALGRRASKGCIRLSNWFNRFIDEYGVLDYHYEMNKESSRAIKYTMSPKKVHTGFDGRYMIIMGNDY